MAEQKQYSETCANCKFRMPMDYCQRFPPTVIVFKEEIASRWPIIETDDWCGEFQWDPSLTSL